MSEKLKFKNDHEAEVWAEVWCHVAGAFGCSSKTTPTAWADAAVLDFRARCGEE